jgi:peptidoglycan/xylan/chitin deacetylase (PgdA/CDA1 family)
MNLDKNKFFQGMILGIFLIVIIVLPDLSRGQDKNTQTNNLYTVNIDSIYSISTLIASSSSVLSPSPTPQEKKAEENFGYCVNVPVLLYHHVQPDSEAKRLWQTALSVDSSIFEQQMSYLVTHGYNTISAKQLVDALLLHTPLPQKSIVLTFDDGYKDAYSYVYPILQKYHILANLMIPSGLVGGTDYLSWGDIEEMSRSGLVYFTNHTWSHYPIDQGGYDKAKYEIQTGRRQLEEHIEDQIVNIFTYPYGSFNNDAIRALRDEGVSGALSTIPGFWQCDSFIMTLHRNRVGNAPLSEYGL